ncbi:hypothetical protein [Algoriphagus sediminis]|uniref:Carbohydrate-binding domain-containing protein n=1 Tax=Algoriphagus sediminis TaxID=3057113 RepID=A0ABT7Y9J8_9BACT|nr:hypothetical protein [Algoriphagus sediminis]MDN3203194.1 hypothetical protein [Algoriphagus sediminis]
MPTRIKKLSITNPLLFAFPLRSEWAVTPVDINKPFNAGDWSDSGKLKFSRGFVYAKNDARYLYLALDVVQDTGNDRGTGDYFWLSFDKNRDRKITANTDINYALYPNQPNRLARQYYLGPGRWTGILPDSSSSEVIQEFGPSEESSASHRIWKFKIELSEINVALSWPFSPPYTYFGFRVKSSNPGFTTDFPGNFYRDFTKLRQLILSRKPSIPTGELGPVIGGIGLIPKTKINQSTGRATTDSGYYVHVENAAFGGTLNLIGNRTKLSQLWSQGARKYEVYIDPPSGPTQKLISNWSNYRWNGSTYVLESFAASFQGAYTLANPSADYSIDDLLIQFPTTALLPGKYKITVRFYKGRVVTATDSVIIYIDNHVPDVNIESIRHGNNEVSACAIENIGPSPDGIKFKITANDSEGNLRSVSFRATYGNSQATSIYSEGYDLSKGNWAGFSNKNVPATGNWRPPQSCAYSFVLTAWARTTNGYGYKGHNSTFRNLTLLLE